MVRPRLLDLFCGAGGAAMGYYRAGFDVVGVDINRQPRYPFTFWQSDALNGIIAGDWDAIHASPPCQRYSAATPTRTRMTHPDLVGATRELLESTGLPYIIENVPGAPLRDPLMLCGSMFGRRMWRHRLFEFGGGARRPVLTHPCTHLGIPVTVYGDSTPSFIVAKIGRHYTNAEKSAVMDIDWMTGNELSQAIPPYYTELLGNQLIAAIAERAA